MHALIPLLCLMIGALLGWLAARGRLTTAVIRAERAEAALAAERRVAGERVEALDEARDRLGDMLAGVSAEALRRNSEQFLQVASGELDQRRLAVEHLVSPLRESLAKVEEQLQGLEITRRSAYAALTEQVRTLGESQERLRDQTRSLADALRAPNVRGRWGEMQLRRVVELAGMLAHCDFVEQPTAVGPDGVLRPDLVVALPGGRSVVVDSKVPLSAYLEAAETTDDAVRRTRLREHARQLKGHVDALSAKAYWQRFEPSPDYVILFVPGEAFLADALDQDPTLLDYAVGKGVVLASPTSLIALLKAVALGWREESLAANARRVCDLGKDLYARLSMLGGHLAGVGQQLDRAVDSYNKAVGSLEGRVFVTARKLRDLDVTDAELAAPPPVERVTRALQAPELVESIPERVVGLAAGPAADPALVSLAGEPDRLPTREEIELAAPA
jgi:DNA recombination protein RmuC